MKLICDTQKLMEVCLNIQRCVPGRSVIPHLEGFLIKTLSDTAIEISGFDLDLGITTTFETTVTEPGSIVLNAKTFCDILRNLEGETVTVDCDEKNICTIRSGELDYTLIGLSADDYPELPTITEGTRIPVSQRLLKDMIKQTIFAVSMDDSKTVHRGVKFELEAGQLRLVALDGFRLAIRSEFLQYDGEPMTFVVPAKALAEIIKFMGDDDEFIELFKGRRHIIFEIGGYSIISRLLEGVFLDYRTAIPTAKSATVRINTAALIRCIESSAPMITERTKSPTRFIFDEDTVKISAVTSIGTFNGKVPCSVDGKRTEIGFNNRFLLEALRSCEGDEVLIQLNGPKAPGIILPTEGESFLYLILPVMLKG
ncbi:MAG: DNA polymerase III subunit beta [Clostridia bacterium]|nr:DNA polymerase III subunit beta [Clostridia bacterium]